MYYLRYLVEGTVLEVDTEGATWNAVWPNSPFFSGTLPPFCPSSPGTPAASLPLPIAGVECFLHFPVVSVHFVVAGPTAAVRDLNLLHSAHCSTLFPETLVEVYGKYGSGTIAKRRVTGRGYIHFLS